MARAAAALGVTNGTVKGDIVVHNGEPYVIELAARLSGGFFCTREIPLNTGVDFIGAAIRIALGEPVAAEELSPRHFTPVIQRYAFPKPGRVVSIAGAEEARAESPASPKSSSPRSRATSFRRPATSGPPPRWCWRPAPRARPRWRRPMTRWPRLRIETA